MYIWEKEVKDIDWCKVTFADGTEQVFPQKKTIEIDVLSYIVTKEPKDASKFQDLVRYKTTDDYLELAKAHDIRKGDVNAVMQLFAHSYDMQFQTAIGKAFGVYKEDTHPASFEEDIRMSDFLKFNN